MREQLDSLASTARRVLSRWFLRRDLRVLSVDALLWLMAGPAALLLIQMALFITGQPAVELTILGWVLLAVTGPLMSVGVRLIWAASHRRIDRRTSLGAFDLQLDTRDRLVTADEFLAAARESQAPADRFRQAAIEDAALHVERALQTTLEPRPLPAWQVSRRSWAAIPAAAALMLLAFWIGGAGERTAAPSSSETVLAAGEAQTLPGRIAATLLNLVRPKPRTDRKPAEERPDSAQARSNPDASPRTRRTDRDAEGQSQAGGQANSRSASQSMTSSGTPSNQQTPSQAVEDDPPQDIQANAATQPKKPDAKKADQQATSATSGQGQSKSSSSDMNKIPATDQPDRAGANKDDGKDEDGIQDEVEEEKTAGVERPSLRRNKPPVDRNLSPRPTGDQPNPNANGRSGPGGRKKTRGVPAMILGVPTPDRIQGMTNPGRSKVTQENSTPKEEPQSALDAEARRAREQAFGHVEHPVLLPWMQTLIERYFTGLRGKK